MAVEAEGLGSLFGYIVLEYEEAGDPRVECPKYIAQLREAFA